MSSAVPATPSLTELVGRARAGERAAWDALVRRLERVVWKVVRTVDLDAAERENAFQNTWFRLFQRIDRIEDPERLPGWLATTARREALRIVAKRSRERPTEVVFDAAELLDDPDHRVIEAELAAALREAFSQLSQTCQQLLRLLTCDPPLSYREIGEVLAVDHGYIGPTRGRCLEALRGMPVLRPFLEAAR